MKLVMPGLREATLAAKPSECVWSACSLQYLGHEFGDGCLTDAFNLPSSCQCSL